MVLSAFLDLSDSQKRQRRLELHTGSYELLGKAVEE